MPGSQMIIITTLSKFKVPLYIYNASSIKSISDVINGDSGTKIVS